MLRNTILALVSVASMLAGCRRVRRLPTLATGGTVHLKNAALYSDEATSILVASLPAASAVSPGLGGLASPAESSADRKNATLYSDEVCQEQMEQLLQKIQRGFLQQQVFGKLQKYCDWQVGNTNSSYLECESERLAISVEVSSWPELEELRGTLASRCPSFTWLLNDSFIKDRTHKTTEGIKAIKEILYELQKAKDEHMNRLQKAEEDIKNAALYADEATSILVASLPAASAVSPGLRGLASTPESSADPKNAALYSDEAMLICQEQMEQLLPKIQRGFLQQQVFGKLQKYFDWQVGNSNSSYLEYEYEPLAILVEVSSWPELEELRGRLASRCPSFSWLLNDSFLKDRTQRTTEGIKAIKEILYELQKANDERMQRLQKAEEDIKAVKVMLDFSPKDGAAGSAISRGATAPVAMVKVA